MTGSYLMLGQLCGSVILSHPRIRLEPPIEQPLGLALLGRDEADDVLAQALGGFIGFDIGYEAVLVLFVDQRSRPTNSYALLVTGAPSLPHRIGGVKRTRYSHALQPLKMCPLAIDFCTQTRRQETWPPPHRFPETAQPRPEWHSCARSACPSWAEAVPSAMYPSSDNSRVTAAIRWAGVAPASSR